MQRPHSFFISSTVALDVMLNIHTVSKSCNTCANNSNTKISLICFRIWTRCLSGREANKKLWLITRRQPMKLSHLKVIYTIWSQVSHSRNIHSFCYRSLIRTTTKKQPKNCYDITNCEIRRITRIMWYAVGCIVSISATNEFNVTSNCLGHKHTHTIVMLDEEFNSHETTYLRNGTWTYACSISIQSVSKYLCSFQCVCCCCCFVHRQ